MHSSFHEKWSQVAFQPRYGKTTVNKWNVKVSLWIQSLGKGAISIYLSMIMTGMLGDWIPIILLDSLEFWFLALPLFYSIFLRLYFNTYCLSLLALQTLLYTSPISSSNSWPFFISCFFFLCYLLTWMLVWDCTWLCFSLSLEIGFDLPD